MDIGPATEWIGRTATREDVLSPRLIGQYRATLPGLLADAGPVPLGMFWMLSPDAEAPADLGRDGHPRLGIHLPPLPLPRRMWAGGEVRFLGDFAPGDTVRRDTTIARIAPKTGSTGSLIFVEVRHVYAVGDRAVVEERQDLVYRPDPDPTAPAPAYPAAPDLGPALASVPLESDSLLLFRFSAMTFNGHRIHYDADYARKVEGYGGLVVHGPLQAVVLMNLAARHLGRAPARFTYRGLSPLICGEPAVAELHPGDGASLALRVVRPGGPVTMAATAEP